MLVTIIKLKCMWRYLTWGICTQKLFWESKVSHHTYGHIYVRYTLCFCRYWAVSNWLLSTANLHNPRDVVAFLFLCCTHVPNQIAPAYVSAAIFNTFRFTHKQQERSVGLSINSFYVVLFSSLSLFFSLNCTAFPLHLNLTSVTIYVCMNMNNI